MVRVLGLQSFGFRVPIFAESSRGGFGLRSFGFSLPDPTRPRSAKPLGFIRPLLNPKPETRNPKP